MKVIDLARITLRKASPEDLDALQKICIQIYSYYFGDYWMGQGLNNYIEEQFGKEALRRDLRNPKVDFYFIVQDNVAVGFAKINFKAKLTGLSTNHTAELEKIYIDPAAKGQGIGKVVMNYIMSIAKKNRCQEVFLGVLGTNDEARKFYEKLGFKHYGTTTLPYPTFKKEHNSLDIMHIKIQ